MEEDKGFMDGILSNIMWIGLGLLIWVLMCCVFVVYQCRKRGSEESKLPKHQKIRNLSNAEEIWRPGKTVFNAGNSAVFGGESAEVTSFVGVPPPNPYQSGVEKQRIVQMIDMDEDIDI
eukprot:24724_1